MFTFNTGERNVITHRMPFHVKHIARVVQSACKVDVHAILVTSIKYECRAVTNWVARYLLPRTDLSNNVVYTFCVLFGDIALLDWLYHCYEPPRSRFVICKPDIVGLPPDNAPPLGDIRDEVNSWFKRFAVNVKYRCKLTDFREGILKNLLARGSVPIGHGLPWSSRKRSDPDSAYEEPDAKKQTVRPILELL